MKYFVSAWFLSLFFFSACNQSAALTSENASDSVSASGVTAHVLTTYSLATETALINQAYETGFGRLPTPQETLVWLNSGSISTTTIITAIKQSLAAQPAAQASTIQLAYKTKLKRSPTPQELTYWQSLMNSGSADYTDVLNTNLVFASKSGAHLNSNISTGGGSDDTSILQSVLYSASASHPLVLYIDGVALISSPLKLSSNTTLQCGSNQGLFLANNAQGAMVSTVGVGVNYQQSNVALVGCVFNGNFKGQTLAPVVNGQTRTARDEALTYSDVNGSPHYYWKTGVWLTSVNGLTIQNVVIKNATTYGLVLTDVANATINNLTVSQDAAVTSEALSMADYNGNGLAHNWDGIHLWGNITNLTINGFNYNGDDDWIAFSGSELAGIDDDPRVSLSRWIRTSPALTRNAGLACIRHGDLLGNIRSNQAIVRCPAGRSIEYY